MNLTQHEFPDLWYMWTKVIGGKHRHECLMLSKWQEGKSSLVWDATCSDTFTSSYVYIVHVQYMSKSGGQIRLDSNLTRVDFAMLSPIITILHK